MKQNELLIAPEKQLFFQYLGPSILSMLAVSGYSFVDTFVVGQAIGANAVAAMGIGTPVSSFLYAIGFLLGTGGAVRFSLNKNTAENNISTSAFSLAVFGAIFFGIVVCIAGNLWTAPLARALGATSGNLELAVQYLRWILSLSGFLILDLVMNNFMRNEGHPNISMIATLSGTVLNIILDFLFVMGFGWGMNGAASATCLASIVSVCINCGYAFFARTALRPRFSKKMLSEILPITKIGLGAFVLEGAVSVISIVFLKAAGRAYGDAGVSAYSVIMTLNLVCYSVLNGVAQSVQPLISSNHAARLQNRLARFLRFGLATALMFGILFFGLAEAFPKFLCGLLVGRDTDVLTLSIRGLRLHAPAFVCMAASILSGIYYQAKGSSVPSFLILLGRSAAFPIILLMVGAPLFGNEMVWISVPIGEFLAVILSGVFLIKSRALFVDIHAKANPFTVENKTQI